MSKTGRPTQYDESMNKQVKKLCRLGATDMEIGDFFGVSKTTINTWKKEHPQFLASLKEGKMQSDYNVAESLYKKALGYTKDGKYYPADTTAIIWWLKNRRRGDWQDKQTISHDVRG